SHLHSGEAWDYISILGCCPVVEGEYVFRRRTRPACRRSTTPPAQITCQRGERLIRRVPKLVNAESLVRSY
ncbi:hypothetical protein KAU37_07170, partial [Candidatus Bipolaricaulota bacterium]|nr:hypothetical protein [Candidatus Bipolaricaulota bacterium]